MKIQNRPQTPIKFVVKINVISVKNIYTQQCDLRASVNVVFDFFFWLIWFS